MSALVIILLSYLPSLFFLGPWAHSGDVSKYLALSLPLCLPSFFFFLVKKMGFQKTCPTNKFILYQNFLLAGLLLFILYSYLSDIWPYFFSPVETDIGINTINAVKTLFIRHMNPYATPITYSYHLGEAYAGYKHGPGMIFSYSPFLLLPQWGFKAVSCFYLFLFYVLCACLVFNGSKPLTANIRNVLIVQQHSLLKKLFF